MLVLAKVKSKTVIGAVLLLMSITALPMGIYACWPEPTQPGQVNIEIYPVRLIQQELVDRGHDIVVDGIWGKNTDLANTIEVTKEN